MITKSILAAAAVAVTVAGFSASSAQAGKKFDIDINLYPSHGYGYDVGYPIYDDTPHYPRHSDKWGISCGEGKWTVRSAHFRKVNTVECVGPSFTYTGWKHGDKYRIKVSRRHGQIISVSELY
jgi:hypothetical protein